MKNTAKNTTEVWNDYRTDKETEYLKVGKTKCGNDILKRTRERHVFTTMSSTPIRGDWKEAKVAKEIKNCWTISLGDYRIGTVLEITGDMIVKDGYSHFPSGKGKFLAFDTTPQHTLTNHSTARVSKTRTRFSTIKSGCGIDEELFETLEEALNAIEKLN